MYKNNQKYCKKSYFGVDVQGVTGSSPVSSTKIRGFEPASGFNHSNPQYCGI
jgi:hypothetical protein